MPDAAYDDMLAQFLTPDSPFGPISADRLPQGTTHAALYDPDNEIDTAVRDRLPVFIIGRRGSGKTAFLRSVPGAHQFDVDLFTPDVIESMGRTVRDLNKLLGVGTLAETVSPVWNACFVASLCARLWIGDPVVSSDECPSAFAFGRRTKTQEPRPATRHASAYLHALRESVKSVEDVDSLGTLLEDVELNGIPLWQAQAELFEALRKQGLRASIFLDSLEEYEDLLYDAGPVTSFGGLALQGLFRAASRSKDLADPIYRVVVCFPAELWHHYSLLSSNPLKDFESRVLLHWSNQELLEMAGRRFLAYLRIYYPDEYRALPATRRSSSRSRWAQDLLTRYLPPFVINGRGQRERTISYLLRHTQLLPRHLLEILNNLFRNRTLFENCISEADVRNAVWGSEDLIVKGILSSFSVLYRELSDACRDLIPQLNSIFSQEEFAEVWRQTGRWRGDVLDALGVLTEVGAVGRVVPRQTDMYVKGDFEYLHVHRLVLAPDDMLCLHPLFLKYFESKATRINSDEELTKPICPLGSDISFESEVSRQIF